MILCNLLALKTTVDEVESINTDPTLDRDVNPRQKLAQTYGHCLRSTRSITDIVGEQLYVFPEYDSIHGSLDRTVFIHIERYRLVVFFSVRVLRAIYFVD